MRHPIQNVSDRFWRKVRLAIGDSCWEWAAALHRLGYGQFGIRLGEKSYRMKQAHRVAWELTNGPIPAGQKVLHRCDNRRCCRPDHLFLGTQLDNIADMVAKGRQRGAPGDSHPGRKLNSIQAEEVRSLLRDKTLRQIDIAKRYGVYPTVISKIAIGKLWKPKEEAK